MTPKEADGFLERMLKKAKKAGRSIIHFPAKGQENAANQIIEQLEDAGQSPHNPERPTGSS